MLIALSQAINPVLSNHCTDLPAPSFTTKNGRNLRRHSPQRKCCIQISWQENRKENLLEKLLTGKRFKPKAVTTRVRAVIMGTHLLNLVPPNTGRQKKSTVVAQLLHEMLPEMRIGEEMLRLVATKRERLKAVDGRLISLTLGMHVCACIRTHRTFIRIVWPVAVRLLMVMESLLNAVESLFWKGCCWGSVFATTVMTSKFPRLQWPCKTVAHCWLYRSASFA